MQQRGWPSLSVAVVHNQELVFSQAFGYADVENKIPATTETIYRAGSITKVFVATMLMQLVENGTVSLDDPLERYLPAYKPRSPFPGTRPSTLRQLATHTSGLPVDAPINFWHYYSSFLWIVLKGQIEMTWYVSKNELLATLPTLEIQHMPNKYSNYSNLGFQLLGIALEKAAQRPFTEYIQTKILKPLNMNNSCFELDDEQRSRFAVGYVYLEPDFDRYLAPEWDLNSATYSGGMFSTPEDLALFLAFQFRDNERDEAHILSGDGLRYMRTPNSVPKPDSFESYGLGWSVSRFQGYQVIAHSGGHLGFTARMEALPELELGIVTMTNARYPEGYIGPEKSVTRIILDKLIAVIQKGEQNISIDSDRVEPDRYTGRYAVAGDHVEAKVKIVDGKLYMTFIQDPEFNEPFLPVDRNRFCFETDPEKNPMLFFNEDDAGNIVSLEFLSFIFKKK